MSKEFSELNGYGVKDAVARAEIEKVESDLESLKTATPTGIPYYSHKLTVSIYTDDTGTSKYVSYAFFVYLPSAEKLTVAYTQYTTKNQLVTDILSKIPKGRYLGQYIFGRNPVTSNDDGYYDGWIDYYFRYNSLSFRGWDGDGNYMSEIFAPNSGYVSVSDNVTKVL